MAGEIAAYREAVKTLQQFDAFLARQQKATETRVSVSIAFKVPPLHHGYPDEIKWEALTKATERLIHHSLPAVLTEYRAALVAKIARLHAEAVKECAAIITEEPPR